MTSPDKPRRWLPIRFLAGLMDAMKRSADQTTRVPGQGTPGYPDWPEVPPPAASADPSVRALRSTRDAQDDDEARLVIDDVDHPQLADPKPQEVGPDEVRHARRPWLDGQRQDRRPESSGVARWQPPKLSLGGRRQLDPILGAGAHFPRWSASVPSP